MFKFLFPLFCFFIFISSSLRAENVAVILPMEHTALLEIKDGFISTMQEHLPDYKVSTFNAQGDMNQMQAILKTVKEYDYVAPIGTVAAQMALKLFSETAIISIASELDEASLRRPNLYVVEDNSDIESHFNFIKKALPQLQKATLIYSSEARIGIEAKQMKSLFSKHNIKLQKLNVNNISELILSLKNIDKDTEAIILLKDHIVVSAVAAILKEAHKQNIPVIAADEGSVMNGADLALGVREKDLGVLGAKIIIDLKNKELKSAYKAQFFIMQNTQSIIKAPNGLTFPYKTIKTRK
jgi:putative ABC transport system substrate-binding protein